MASSAAPPVAAPTAIKRLDYTPVAFTTTAVDLVFNIGDKSTRVTATSKLARLYTPDAGEAVARPVVLNRGDPAIQTLMSIAVDGKELAPADYVLTEKTLTFTPPAAAVEAGFVLSVITDVLPEENTALEGLYKSGTTYCTQCEAEGFRK